MEITQYFLNDKVKKYLWPCLIGLLGVFLYVVTPFFAFEEKFGLNWLFQMRGLIPAPNNVAIVAIDKPSVEKLDIPISSKEWPRNVSKWPRSLHSQLIQRLSKEGASLIVFDLVFDTASQQFENDEKFAAAMQEFGSVILIQRLDRNQCENSLDTLQQTDFSIVEECTGMLLNQFTATAKAAVPFPLARAEQIKDYWLFKESFGDGPTAPVVLLQALALPLFNEFSKIMLAVDPTTTVKLPTNVNTMDLHDLALDLRNIFLTDKQLAPKMQHQLSQNLSLDLEQKQLIASLLNIYSGEKKRYFNFYGPPRSIQTIPYYQALIDNTESNTFRNKIVFVGFSAATQSEQDIGRDDYHTVFSNDSGLNISGVELIATAFANLYENKPIRTFPYSANWTILFVFGFLITTVFSLPQTRLSLKNIAGLSFVVLLIYLVSAYYFFSKLAIWLPIFIPILQTISAFIVTQTLKHHEVTLRAKQLEDQVTNLRKFFGSTFPNDSLEKIIGSEQNEQGIYGCCLNTDIQGFCALAEPMEPRILGQLLEKYRNVLKKPIREHDGYIMDMIADSMLAVWISNPDDSLARKKACQASLEVAMAVEQFNQQRSEGMPPFPTRLGLHFGEMSLKREQGCYRVTGDVVNATNRIQNMNKNFKTRILLSTEMNVGLEDFLFRPLGTCQLRGKVKPVNLFELINHKNSATEDQVWLCEIFNEAFTHYQSHNWSNAQKYFLEILKAFPDDGPAYYFVKICQDQS